MVFCIGCGKEIHESATACPHCGAPQRVVVKAQVVEEQTIPEGIKGWSWGAFLLNWIWAIGNNTWIGLIALIPYVNIVMAIVLGIKGREWAWKNKKWDSVEHFNSVQKKWSYWGVVVVAVVAVLGIALAVGIPAYKDYQVRAEYAAIEKQAGEEQRAEAAKLEALQASQQANQEARLKTIQAENNASSFGLNEWQSGYSQGVTEYAIHDGNGNGLAIACKSDEGGSAEVVGIATIGGVEYDSKSRFDIDLVIDGKKFKNPFSTGCMACAPFQPFWEALRNAKSAKISVDGKLVDIPLKKIAEALPEYSSKDNSCVPME